MGLFARAGAALSGFAVVDVETSGLYPSSDRIVEIAVVQLDTAGVTGEFCTLVDPGRDVGPTRIHGLKASDVVGAPRFADAAATVWELLRGRVLVAHNVSFDERFLAAEFERCGVRLPPPPVMCTMALSAHYIPGSPGRSLTACCDTAGIAIGVHHSALDDAVAAAGLLRLFRSAHYGLPGSWAEALDVAVSAVWVPAPPQRPFLPVTRASQVLRRAGERPPLAGLADRLPRGRDSGAEWYLAVLDRVLEDRFVSDGELAAVTGLATELGLTREAAGQAHRVYLRQVCDAAWRDGRVTDAEQADLLEVARLLGVPAQEALAILDAAKSGPSAEVSCRRPPSLRVTGWCLPEDVEPAAAGDRGNGRGGGPEGDRRGQREDGAGCGSRPVLAVRQGPAGPRAWRAHGH